MVPHRSLLLCCAAIVLLGASAIKATSSPNAFVRTTVVQAGSGEAAALRKEAKQHRLQAVRLRKLAAGHRGLAQSARGRAQKATDPASRKFDLEQAEQEAKEANDLEARANREEETARKKDEQARLLEGRSGDTDTPPGSTADPNQPDDRLYLSTRDLLIQEQRGIQAVMDDARANVVGRRREGGAVVTAADASGWTERLRLDPAASLRALEADRAAFKNGALPRRQFYERCYEAARKNLGGVFQLELQEAEALISTWIEECAGFQKPLEGTREGLYKSNVAKYGGSWPKSAVLAMEKLDADQSEARRKQYLEIGERYKARKDFLKEERRRWATLNWRWVAYALANSVERGDYHAGYGSDLEKDLRTHFSGETGVDGSLYHFAQAAGSPDRLHFAYGQYPWATARPIPDIQPDAYTSFRMYDLCRGKVEDFRPPMPPVKKAGRTVGARKGASL